MNPSFQSVAMHRFGGSVDKRRAREPATGEGGASKYLSLFLAAARPPGGAPRLDLDQVAVSIPPDLLRLRIATACHFPPF